MSLFWIENSNVHFTYEQFIQDLNSSKCFNRYIYDRNPYVVFLNFVGNIINNYDFEILDHDFSKNELKNIGIAYDDIEKNLIVNKIYVGDKKDLIKRFIDSRNSSQIIMYTSGTTGKPKKITHKFKNLMNSCKVDTKFASDVWAFAYNPTHFAGVQVFLQAFINQNTMVYVFDKETKDVINLISEVQITRISATPTFYKKIIPSISEEVRTVKSLTSGGEKFDQHLMPHIERVFPNAKIVNVYASTEAGSLFSTKDEYFLISEKYKDKIKVSNNSELMIHESLIAFSDEIEFVDGYYNTKDVIEFYDESKFKFVSRNSDFINVGGYRVNPLEIEEIILQSGYAREVLVYGRKNSVIGNIVVAEVIKVDSNMNDSEVVTGVKLYLKDKVQDWKEPRMYKIVDNIEITRTGKKVRKNEMDYCNR